MPESAKETPAPIESKPVLVSLSSPPLALETIAIGEKCFGVGGFARKPRPARKVSALHVKSLRLRI